MLFCAYFGTLWLHRGQSVKSGCVICIQYHPTIRKKAKVRSVATMLLILLFIVVGPDIFLVFLLDHGFDLLAPR